MTATRKPKPLSSLRLLIQEADVKAGMYLGNYNAEVEAHGETEKAQRLYAKAQFWLDKLNKLSGNG